MHDAVFLIDGVHDIVTGFFCLMSRGRGDEGGGGGGGAGGGRGAVEDEEEED